MIHEFKNFVIDDEIGNISIKGNQKSVVLWRVVTETIRVFFLLFIFYIFSYKEGENNIKQFCIYVALAVTLAYFFRRKKSYDTKIDFAAVESASYKHFFYSEVLIFRLRNTKERIIYTKLTNNEIAQLAIIFKRNSIFFEI